MPMSLSYVTSNYQAMLVLIWLVHLCLREFVPESQSKVDRTRRVDGREVSKLDASMPKHSQVPNLQNAQKHPNMSNTTLSSRIIQTIPETYWRTAGAVNLLIPPMENVGTSSAATGFRCNRNQLIALSS